MRAKALGGQWPAKPAEDIAWVIVRENSVGIRSGVSDGIGGGI